MIDSVYKIANNFYPQVLLEEYKCFVKKKTKVIWYITDDQEISVDDSDKKDQKSLVELMKSFYKAWKNRIAL